MQVQKISHREKVDDIILRPSGSPPETSGTTNFASFLTSDTLLISYQHNLIRDPIYR